MVSFKKRFRGDVGDEIPNINTLIDLGLQSSFQTDVRTPDHTKYLWHGFYTRS